jgi:quinol monooxygenase YgiN
MYGTVARFRLKPGMEDRMLELTHEEVVGGPIPGCVAQYIYRLDTDPHAYYLAVIFDSKASYVAHTNSPQSNARYQQISLLLEGTPEWHDGEIIFADPHVPRRAGPLDSH